MSAAGWDEFVILEREACARICDREALREVTRGVWTPGFFGNPNDAALQAAWRKDDWEAFVGRALEIDTQEARDVRARTSCAGRMAAKIRQRAQVDSHPGDWRPPGGYMSVPDLEAKNARPRKESLR